MIAEILLALSAATAPLDSAVVPDTARSLTTPPWSEAAVSASADFFGSRLAAWQSQSMSLRYRASTASHAVEVFSMSRFDVRDAGIGVEESRVIGRGAYVVGRAQFAPGATITARSDFSASLFKSVGDGWELAPSLRLMSYTDQRVTVVSLGAGRYSGLWFAGGRLSQARQGSSNALTSTLQARRYRADASPDFLDASISSGTEIVVRGPDNLFRAHTSAASLRGQKLLTRNTGISVGVTYDRLESLPDRRGIGASLFFRW